MPQCIPTQHNNIKQKELSLYEYNGEDLSAPSKLPTFASAFLLLLVG
jgi:hypothetical protein